MTYDCFIFFNELDLLEIRLNVLKDVVDKFVLVEATKTHTGKPKPLHYAENKARYAAFADRIIHVVVDDFPDPPSGCTERQASWMRENFQRNAILRGLVEAQDDDLILISDLDEIPRPELLASSRNWSGVTVCEQMFLNFFVNYLDHVRPWWKGTRILPRSVFHSKARPVRQHYAFIENVNHGMTPTRVRFADADRIEKRAGWHFSYLGGVASVLDKIGSVGLEYEKRANLDETAVLELIAKGEDITGCGGRYFAVPLDSRFPRYLLDNRAKYAPLIYVPDDDYYRRKRLLRIEAFLRGWIRKNGAKLIPRPFKDWLYRNIYSRIVKKPIVM